MSRLGIVAALMLFTGLILSACSGSNQEPASMQPTTEPESQMTENPPSASTEEPMPTEDKSSTGNDYSDLEIITLLPQDAIPAIDNPQFLSGTEADEEYAPDELILGVEFNGDARAYSINYLSGHEIVNDEVGGVKLSVTW